MADDEIPPEVHHYSSLQEVPWDIQKYAPFPPLQEEPRAILTGTATGPNDTRFFRDMTRACG